MTLSSAIHLKIGTRGSRLALWQAKEVKRLILERVDNADVTIVPISTRGDTMLSQRMTDIGEKGLFTGEIEQALTTGEIDLAVHSMKDLPSDLPKGLAIAAVLKREEANDVLAAGSADSLLRLPLHARIGTSSLRRSAQLKALRPDFEIVALRGNVETRLKKVKEEGLDGAVLAYAGMKRLGLTEQVTQVLALDMMLPAPCQGIIAIETKEGSHAYDLMQTYLNDADTACAATAERVFLRTMEGGCRLPMAAYASFTEDALHLTGSVFSTDGTKSLTYEAFAQKGDEEDLGKKVAGQLLEDGAREILREVLREREAQDGSL